MNESDTPFMIEADSLTKQYGGNTAVSNLTFSCEPGEIVGFLGPNGAGKTTTMRILTGYMPPTSGDAYIAGFHTVDESMQARQKLGYLPETVPLYPEMTVEGYLHFIGQVRRLENVWDRVDDVLEAVDLLDRAESFIGNLSKGMRQRVGIAQALLGEPRLLIVDEPTAGLDPEERVRLRNLLSEMAQRCTVILSTHIVEDISQSCNDLAVIGQGQVLFHGRPRDLIGQARGHVWAVTTTTGQPPAGGASVVSSVQLESGTRYRVLGEAPLAGAEPLEPTLEDGYMWLMQRVNAAPGLAPA